MDLNRQVFRAPSIPKIGRRNVSSSVIRGALKPQIKLNRSTFSFIKPSKKEIDVEKISKVSVEKNISVEATLGETNRILVEIQKQLALDFGYRITEEKKALAAERKRIAAQKVSDKEASIEKGGKGILGKTFDKVVAPFKSIFQKLIDFFSIILTGILLNTAFKWLSNKENRKKLKQFFDFIKEYWQELLIIFAAYKLARLVSKVFNIANNIKKVLGGLGKLIDRLRGRGKKKKSPLDPCDCPDPGTPDFCKNILDCFDPQKVESLAQQLSKTTTFSRLAPLLTLQPTSKPTEKTLQPQQTSWWKRGGLPKGLSDYMNNLQSGPTAEEKLFKQLNLPPWLAPIVESIATAVLMSKGRGIGAGGIRINPQQYSRPIGPYQRSVRNPLQSIEPIDTTLSISKSRIKIKKGYAEGLKKSKPTIAGKESREVKYESLLGKLGETIRKEYAVLKNKGYSEDQIYRMLEKTFGKSTIDDYINLSRLPARSKGGTIPGLSQGGTVGGRGSGLVDTIPAMLAAGEEVIRTSMAMMWRPLLKDINDNGAKLWMSFQRGTLKQDLNNKINYELNVKLMGLLKELLEIVSIDTKRIQKNKNRGGGRGSGGGIDRSTIGGNFSTSPITDYPLSDELKRLKMQLPVEKTYRRNEHQITPNGLIDFMMPSWMKWQSIPDSPYPHTSYGKEDFEKGVRYNPFFQDLIRFPYLESTPREDVDYKMQYAPSDYDRYSPEYNTIQAKLSRIPIQTRNLQRTKGQPRVNVINLPPETVSVGPKPGSLKLPSSGEATTVPSISPFDASNAYIAFTPDKYGMVI